MNSGLLTQPNLINGKSLASCPSCKDQNLKTVGAIPDAFFFLTQHFTHPINKGDLVKCQSCGLLFRNPCLSLETMNELYKTNPLTIVWGGSNETREDFRQVTTFISSLRAPNLKILDVGCYKGSLLNTIRRVCEHGGGYTLHGIEPSREARVEAEKNGIKIVGESLYDLKGISAEKYDIIILTDVFEHLQDSDLFMKYLSGVLLPGGYIVITSGAYDSKPFQSAKNLYYYAAMPEHISFLSQKHALWLAQKYELDLSYEFIRHSRRSAGIIKLVVLSLLFLVLRMLPLKWFFVESNIVNRLAGWRGRGIQNIFNQPDHAMAVFHKRIQNKKGKEAVPNDFDR